ncbi:MAG: FAD-binding protein, partial [Acidimicrobiia bacterium]|nr:FAD-binding protein [Acidimicrobiia bacterium]
MTSHECDILCIGGGLGGLAAALRAADAGLEALIVEKSPLIGGVAAYSGGVVWVGNNHLQRQAGIDDSAHETSDYLRWVARDAGPFDADLLETFIRRAPEAVEHFARLGVAFASTGLGDQYHPDAPGSKASGRILEVTAARGTLGPWRNRFRSSPHFRLLGLTHDEVRRAGGDLVAGDVLADLHRQRREADLLTWGPGLSAGFAGAALVRRGVPILLKARCVELIHRAGRIGGAVVETAGTRIEVRARRGVLIATGSYGNAPWAAELEGLPEIFEASPPVLDGDAFALVEPTGAARARAGQAFTIFGYESPTERHPGTNIPLHRELSRALGLPHSIVVNSAGRRFGDESFYGFLLRAVKQRDEATGRFPNHPCYLIGDNRYRTRYRLGDGEEWPANLVQAPNLADLAAVLGIDAAGLIDQVAAFNDAAEEGNDPAFGRGTLPYSRRRAGDPNQSPNPNLGSLRAPPFWGLPLKLLGTGIYSTGLLINSDAQVLTEDRRPIDGLYATGNAAAYTAQPGYVGGLAHAR